MGSQQNICNGTCKLSINGYIEWMEGKHLINKLKSTSFIM